MRPGIFAAAMDKVNLMQPEFVLSVGDLIDGYTEDPEVWNAQWDEFDAIVDKLDMKFYYVPGNHDTSNELLTQVWKDRHGRDYYHFLYNNVLFVILNTDAIKNGGLGEEQITYFEDVLSEHEDVRWTFVFMHRPLWSYGDKAGYEKIEQALGTRSYTVFSGHHHHYRYKIHNGMEHYTLATTGGGSWMRNKNLGEFDHITWVTMKDKEPEIAHIEIDGILEPDIVSEADYADIQVIRRGEWMSVQPSVMDAAELTDHDIVVELRNTAARPMKVHGTFPPQHGISFYPDSISKTLAPGVEETLSMQLKATDQAVKMATLDNHPLQIELMAGFEREPKPDIQAPATGTILMDWIHPLPKATCSINVDGKLTEWDNNRMITVEAPQYLRQGWDWKGKEDGNLQFAACLSDNVLYIGARFNDDTRILKQHPSDIRFDKFYVDLAIGTDSRSPLSAVIYLDSDGQVGVETGDTPWPSLAHAMITTKEQNQILELAIPLQALSSLTIDELKEIRINIGVMDHDRPENTKPSEFWWRPVWDSEVDYERSGIFRIIHPE